MRAECLRIPDSLEGLCETSFGKGLALLNFCEIAMEGDDEIRYMPIDELAHKRFVFEFDSVGLKMYFRIAKLTDVFECLDELWMNGGLPAVYVHRYESTVTILFIL